MIKHYNYTFTYYGQEITISKSVSDKMEERELFKKGEAAKWMTDTLRAHTGDKYFKCVLGYKLVEVRKKDTVKIADTFKAMDDAKAYFKSLTREEIFAWLGY